MQMAIDAAGFTAAEADRLRQAMGAKRSTERMAALRGRFYDGMAANGISGPAADEIWDKMAAFASFGFPESHAVSFAYLVYSSAWLKLHYPAAFLAGLLNSQPMGFWSPATLVADARRHGVIVHRPDVNAGGTDATLTAGEVPDRPAVRLGLGCVRTLGAQAAARVVAGRPYRDLADLARRAGLRRPQLEALAIGGALAGLAGAGSAGAGSEGASPGGDRRRALWAVGILAGSDADQFDGATPDVPAPSLPAMTVAEEVAADLWATGISTGASPTSVVRAELDARGVTTAADLKQLRDRRRVTVAGVVTHRQRPETARGVTFVNVEDETGLVNVICPPAVWARHRPVARAASALVVHGRLEAGYGVVNVVAERIEPLALPAGDHVTSRDFH